jgi:hypothetical protein
METKTVKEWLEKLPDGYRERALANLMDAKANNHAISIAGAIDLAFNWGDTNEGFEFWKGIHKAYSCSKLPPLPTEK